MQSVMHTIHDAHLQMGQIAIFSPITSHAALRRENKSTAKHDNSSPKLTCAGTESLHANHLNFFPMAE